MDYGISFGVSCFSEGLIKDDMFSAWWPRLCELPSGLLFSGCHFVLQLPASCQNEWEHHVNTQLCLLTLCGSHVEVCTAQAVGSIACHLEIMNQMSLLTLGEENRACSCFQVSTLLLKEWMAPAMLNREGLMLYAAPSIKTILQDNREGCIACWQWLVASPHACGWSWMSHVPQSHFSVADDWTVISESLPEEAMVMVWKGLFLRWPRPATLQIRVMLQTTTNSTANRKKRRK